MLVFQADMGYIHGTRMLIVLFIGSKKERNNSRDRIISRYQSSGEDYESDPWRLSFGKGEIVDYMIDSCINVLEVRRA